MNARTQKPASLSRWTCLRLVAVFALAAISLLQTTTIGLAAGNEHAEVIAQGVAPMPAGPVTWRVMQRQALPSNQARPASRALGFTLAAKDSFLVTDQVTKRQVILDQGEAAFHGEGDRDLRQSLTDHPASYYDLDLIVADSARSDATIGDGKLLFAGDGFTMPQGTRQLELSRDVLHAGERGTFVGSKTPMLIFVTGGGLEVKDGTRTRQLFAGDAALVSGNLTLAGAPSTGGTYVVARVGRSVPQATSAPAKARTPAPTPVQTQAPTPAPTQAASQPTGTLEITIFSCPQGVDPPQSTDGCQPGQSADGGYVQINQGEIVASGQQFMLSDAVRDGDAYVLANIPAATYAIKGFAKPGEGAVLFFTPPVEAGQDAWMVTVGAGQTVSINGYWYDPSTVGTAQDNGNMTGQNGQTGQLAFWFYACPAGTDPTSNADLATCRQSDDPYGFGIVDTQGSGNAYSTADAGRNNGGYILTIPASVYRLTGSVPDGVAVYVLGDHVAGGGTNVALNVPAGTTSNVSIYIVPDASGSGG